MTPVLQNAVQIGGGTQRLSDQVYEFIKDQLLNGNYGAEDWISVEDISAKLSVSRQPVMGALQRLSEGGLVEIVPQVGCRPRRYQLDNALDFYQLFAEGEALLAGLAAKRAERGSVLKLKILSSAIQELTTRRDSDPASLGRLYRPLNNQFHAEIHRIANSPLCANAVEMQRDLSDFFVAVTERPIFGDRLAAAHEEHERIMEAIAQGDSKTATRIMRAHVLCTAQRLPPQSSQKSSRKAAKGA